MINEERMRKIRREKWINGEKGEGREEKGTKGNDKQRE